MGRITYGGDGSAGYDGNSHGWTKPNPPPVLTKIDCLQGRRGRRGWPVATDDHKHTHVNDSDQDALVQMPTRHSVPCRSRPDRRFPPRVVTLDGSMHVYDGRGDVRLWAGNTYCGHWWWIDVTCPLDINRKAPGLNKLLSAQCSLLTGCFDSFDWLVNWLVSSRLLCCAGPSCLTGNRPHMRCRSSDTCLIASVAIANVARDLKRMDGPRPWSTIDAVSRTCAG